MTDTGAGCPLHQFHPCLSRAALVRDPHDQVFLDLALAAATPVLVSGDADLLALKQEVVPLQIINPADFQSWLATNP
jgi:predicted nucleic acid-binding protein